MMMSPLKLGIAVACLLGVAVLIAVDLGRDRKEETSPAVPASLSVGSPVPPAPVAPVASPDPAPRAPSPSPANRVQEGPAAATPAGGSAEKKGPVAKTEAPEPAKAGNAEKGAAPSVTPVPAKTATPENLPAKLTTYTVLQGDTLYGISVKVFGTPRYYERIFEENRDRISDPNTLQIGLNLKMPDVPLKTGAGSAAGKGREPGPVPAAPTLPAGDPGSKDLR